MSSLCDIADYFLIHDREIIVPVDDAVVKVVCGEAALVRCGRGYAPVTLPLNCPHPLLATGAQQKNTVCIAAGEFAALSQHIGDLDSSKGYAVFQNQIAHFEALFDCRPQIIAHDLNPDYLSSGYAQAQAGKKIAIQHHHAHLAGCMAENQLDTPVIGIICDGTGLGTDGAVWGGEFLIGTPQDFVRAGHLAYVTLQGAQAAVEQPWRCAACYLSMLGIAPDRFLPQVNRAALKIARIALQSDINCCQSSSMGRLFDCVAALCGFQSTITFDAQAAVWLENLADEQTADSYRYVIAEDAAGITLEYGDLLRDLLADLERQTARPMIAARFHNTLIAALTDCALRIKKRRGLRMVVLSGGVFENSLLLEGLITSLERAGFTVYFNRRTPANDGGIAFGQAAAAGAIIKEMGYVSCNSGQNHPN